ncbi:DUF397 domain-containing protein [Streptomyces niveiscabiei]|uniref:DUF397 domain-containing protein n=1 Tax=Streptomyces niveiscabiei TaxID=164115 RepID=A0ABW9I7Z1_9ACTN
MSKSKPAPSEFDLSAVEWVVSSHSGGGGDCVRVGTQDGFVLVGDSKNPDRLPHRAPAFARIAPAWAG